MPLKNFHNWFNLKLTTPPKTYSTFFQIFYSKSAKMLLALKTDYSIFIFISHTQFWQVIHEMKFYSHTRKKTHTNTFLRFSEKNLNFYSNKLSNNLMTRDMHSLWQEIFRIFDEKIKVFIAKLEMVCDWTGTLNGLIRVVNLWFGDFS